MLKIYGFKRVCAACLAFLIALGAFGISAKDNAIKSSADKTEDSYESQLEELRQQQSDIDARIAEAQKKIDEENSNLEAINDKYKALKEKIENVEAQSLELEDQMVELDTQLREAQYSLEAQNEEIEKTTSDFMQRIRAMYVVGGANSYENVIANSSDFYDVLMRMELIKRVASHDNDALDKLMEQKRAIEETERQITEQTEQLKTKAQDYAETQSELADQQAELLKMKEESGSVISDLEKDRDQLMDQSRQLADDYSRISSLAETTTTTTTTSKKTTTSTKKSEDGKTTTTKKTEKTTTTTTKESDQDGTTTTKATTTTAPKTTTTTTTAAPTPPPDDNTGGSRQEKIDTVIAYAKSNVGGAYVWGGASFRACDCSGLMMISFAKVGISLPHYAASQATYGTTVSYSNIQPGDVVFFGGSSISSIYHVGLYIGDGKMVHAQNSATGIVISNLASFSRYNNITIIKRLI